MTSEQDLAAALRSFEESVELADGDAAHVAKRGRRRQRARTAKIGGGLAIGLVVVGMGVALNRTDGTTVIAAASSLSTTVVPSTDDQAEADPGVATTVAGSRSSAPLSETTTLNAVDMRQLVADQVMAEALCDTGDGGLLPDVTIDQVQTVNAPGDVTIANVTCVRGAYQPTSVVLFVVDADTRTLQPVAVDWFDGQQISSETLLYGMVDVLLGEAGDVSLSVYVRYRGAGDCGMAMSHRWEPAEARGFVLETAHGIAECPETFSDKTPTDWPQLYPPLNDPSSSSSSDWTDLVVSPACEADELPRRASDLRNNPKVMTCLKETLIANTDARQFWIEDVIDDGDNTLVVWRASRFDGDFGLGTPWGHEEIHVTELTTWTDKLVRRLDWEDPIEADWMYAYRIEFVDPATLKTMIGWHQGECYWVDRLDLDGNVLDAPGNPYPRPATLDELAADESLCVFSIEDEPAILASRFSNPEPVSYFDD